MNTVEKLVAMVNQIATNQMHEPDPAKATADHIRLYWDPRMKRMIFANGSTGLSKTAAAAIALLAETHDRA
jgi:formate dehydrogenase subunit delta